MDELIKSFRDSLESLDRLFEALSKWLATKRVEPCRLA